MPLPLILGAGVKTAGGFLLRNMDKILFAAAIGLGLWLVQHFGYQRGVAKVTVVLEAERRAWADERAQAAKIAAARDRRYRQLERDAADEIAALRDDHGKAVAAQAARNAVLDGSRRQLLEHVTRLVSVTGGPAAAAGTAGEPVQPRLEALGVLVERIDALADECVRDADAGNDELRAWRRFGDAAKSVNAKLRADAQTERSGNDPATR